MKLLLDTHVLVLLANEPGRMDTAMQAAVFNAAIPLTVSAVSIWEIRIKSQLRHASGDPKLPLDPETALRLAEALGCRILPISALHASTRLQVPLPHRDPFDDLLLVQAQVEDLYLLTRDQLLAGHPRVAPV